MNKILLNIGMWILNFTTMYINVVEWINNNASIINLSMLFVSSSVSVGYIIMKGYYHRRSKILDEKKKDLEARILELDYDERFRESLRDCQFD